MTKVSIVLPVYNTEKYLSQCLDSIINQTFKDFECICINDGSTDSSLKILEDYAKKDIRIKIINQENKGIAYVRNIGINNAKSEYLIFVDSDDWLDKKYLKILYETIVQTDSEIVSCNYKEYYEKEKNFVSNILPKERMFLNNDKLSLKISKAYAQPTLWSKIFKISFLKNNKISFFEDYFVCEDAPFVALVFLYLKKITYIDNVLYFYRKQINSSITANKTNLFIGKVYNSIRLMKETTKRNLFDDDIFKITYKFLFWDLSSFYKKDYSDETRKYFLIMVLKLITNIEQNKNVLCFISLLKLKFIKFILVCFKVKSYRIIRILKNFIF